MVAVLAVMVPSKKEGDVDNVAVPATGQSATPVAPAVVEAGPPVVVPDLAGQPVEPIVQVQQDELAKGAAAPLPKVDASGDSSEVKPSEPPRVPLPSASSAPPATAAAPQESAAAG